jgi:sugar phosphate isomerase/epimerase
MILLNRRAFLGALAASPASLLATRLTRPLGLQLYTVRTLLPTQARETLRQIAEIGFDEVETAGDPRQFADLYKEFGLKPTAAHWEAPLVTGNWKAWSVQFPNGQPPGYTWDAAIEATAGMGIRYMVISYLMPAERQGVLAKTVYQRFADAMNKAGEKAKAAGLRLCYHNHAFEFAGKEGDRPFDRLEKGFDPDLVCWELDVFWAALAGHDPAALIREYPKRIRLLHLKDLKPGAPRMTDERLATPDLFKEVGAGSLNFPDILRAAAQANVDHYYVEQDECPGNPLDSLRQSHHYLKK